MVAAWKTNWQKTLKNWVDYPNSLHKVMKTFNNIINQVPMLQEYARTASQLKDSPWIESCWIWLKSVKL